MPIGRSRNTSPNLLPSRYAFSGSRRFTGTSARIIMSPTSSPRCTRYPRSAPATDESSTSLTEQPSALPIVLTSSSAIGSAQATRFATPDSPLNGVAESSPISASLAISPVSAPPCSASAMILPGSRQSSVPFSMSVEPAADASFSMPAKGESNCASASSSASPRFAADVGTGPARRPARSASVIDSRTWIKAIPSA